MSASGRPPAAVRMITPPPKPCSSRNFRTMPRRRLRSSRDSILRDTPTWSTVGMKTRNRPARVACDVRRAPLVPSGSLATWTTISWPSFRSSSIFGWGRARGPSPPPSPGVARRPPRRPIEALEFLDRVDDIRDVQEAVALEADVNERALHAGQHFRDPALVDVADDSSMPLALDEISVTRSSSRMATIVSWPLAEMIISLLMRKTPCTDRPADSSEQSARRTCSNFRKALLIVPMTRLISEPTHPHVEDQAEARQRGDHRRPAITHQRKRQTLDRRQAGRHRDVVNHLKREAGHQPHHEIRRPADPWRDARPRASARSRSDTGRARTARRQIPVLPPAPKK